MNLKPVPDDDAGPVHDAFLSSQAGRTAVEVPERDVVRLAVAGTGGVGGAFLDQLAEHGKGELASRGIELRLVAVGRSSRAAVVPDGLDPARWREILGSAMDEPGRVVDAVTASAAPGILVDCTASAEVGGRHLEVVRAGGAVVTANKLSLAGSLDLYRSLTKSQDGTPRIYHETTVGAGLPVLQAVRSLRASGDPVRRIEGVLSGSLSFIFQEVNDGSAFSAAVRHAASLGLTEPHPGEDLGLNDVLRKLVILAREAGFPLEPHEVAVEPLLPSHLLEIAEPDAFLAALEEVDPRIEARRAEALRDNARLMPVGRLDETGARVELQAVPSHRPLARIPSGDNLVEIETRRYARRPMVIQGPGAGTEVTAAGVLVDVLAAAERLVIRGVGGGWDDRSEPRR